MKLQMVLGKHVSYISDRTEADNPGMVLEYTQHIDAASQHLLGLINDVLDMPKKAADNEYNILKGKNILIVDDIEVNRIILNKILTTQCV